MSETGESNKVLTLSTVLAPTGFRGLGLQGSGSSGVWGFRGLGHKALESLPNSIMLRLKMLPTKLSMKNMIPPLFPGPDDDGKQEHHQGAGQKPSNHQAVILKEILRLGCSLGALKSTYE